MRRMLHEFTVRMWSGRGGAAGVLISALLLPVSMLYRVAVALARVFGARGRRRIPRPGKSGKRPFIISIGSITAGGAGKTLTTILVARLAGEAGIRTAVASRGYGRKSRGLVMFDATRPRPAMEVGDEPLVISRALPRATVAVCADRFAALEALAAETDCEAVVMDDAFQHFSVMRDLDVVSVELPAPFGNGRLLPAGPMREPLCALRRASVFVVIGDGDAEIPDKIFGMNPDAPVLRARKRPVCLFDLATGGRVDAEKIAGRRIFCFAGLGRMDSFLRTVGKAGGNIAGAVDFPDHYRYRQSDVNDITAKSAGCDMIVTTEKDEVRLEGMKLPPGLFSLRVELELNGGAEAFLGMMKLQ